MCIRDRLREVLKAQADGNLVASCRSNQIIQAFEILFESYSVEIIQLVAFQGVDRFYNPSFEDNAAVSFDVAIVLQLSLIHI